MLPPEEEEIASHYRKMLKMGMPEGAVSQKMAVDGVASSIQDVVLAPEPESPPPPTTSDTNALTSEEEEIASQYQKMLKMGMPDGAVAQKMSVDGVEQKIKDYVLAPQSEPVAETEPENSRTPALTSEEEEVASQYQKMLKMGMPEGAVAQKMSVDGVEQKIQNYVLAPPSEPETETEPEDPQTPALTPDEEEVASQYQKMLKMGMPEGAVAQKMSVDGVEQKIQDYVLAPPADPVAETEPEGTQPTALSPEAEEIASQYQKMLKMGMPEGAVAQKMSVDGVAQNVQDFVLATPEPEPEAQSEPQEEDTTQALTQEEEEIASQYRKMLKMGMPAGAVGQKMSVDGVAQNIQDAVLAPPEETTTPTEAELDTPAAPVLTPDEEKIAGQYKKMLSMGMPAGAVAQKMSVDCVDQKIQDTVLAPPADAASSENEAEGEGSQPEVEAGDGQQNIFLATPRAKEEEADERAGDEEYEYEDVDLEEEVFEDEVIEEEDEETPGDRNTDDEDFDALAVGAIAIMKGETVDPDVDINTNAVGGEELIVFEQEDGDGQRDIENQASQPRSRKKAKRSKSNPDRVFHWFVTFIYVLMIGGAVAAALLLMDDDDDDDISNEQKPLNSPTTPLDPIDTDSCDFSGSTQPHVVDQCRCSGRISILSIDVRLRYSRHKAELVPLIYQNFDETIGSCSVRNQALVWLSTANDYEFTELERSQRYALASLFIGMEGEGWSESTNWLSEEPVCSWAGVDCTEEGFVENLALDSVGAGGSLPREVVILQQLVSLSLTDNELDGEIPMELFFIPTLKSLFLNDNKLTGPLPVTVSEATLLQDLDVANNELEGTIPSGLSLATDLTTLNLGDNNFEGDLLPWIFSFSQLLELSVHSNNLEGTIPQSIASGTSLKRLNLGSNDLEGSIPVAIGSLSNLEQLSLRNLDLTGVIPASLVSLSNLVILTISETNIEGSIPPVFANMNALKVLNLGSNLIGSEIPPQLRGLPLLEELNLSSNVLTGPIPVELGGFGSLRELWLHDNFLTGSVPAELGNLESLAVLTLEDTHLEGAMPDEVCELRDSLLQELVVDCGDVQCEVPECCTRCKED